MPAAGHEIDFDVVALVAADAVPLVAAILNVGGNADRESEGSVKERGVDKELSKGDFVRVGESDAHCLIIGCSLLATRSIGNGFRDDADVVDAGDAQSVDDGSEYAERNGFVAA